MAGPALQGLGTAAEGGRNGERIRLERLLDRVWECLPSKPDVLFNETFPLLAGAAPYALPADWPYPTESNFGFGQEAALNWFEA